MKYPKNIAKGDTIHVTAPSSGIGDDVKERSLSLSAFKNAGFNIIETDDVMATDGEPAVASVRAMELMEALSSKESSMVLSASGGDFMDEILDLIDFDELKDLDKWFQGYSDNTNLTFTLTTLNDIATIYGTNFKGFAMKTLHKSLEDSIKILLGEDIVQESFDRHQRGFLTTDEGYDLNTESKLSVINAPTGDGNLRFKGRMIGGCLDVLRNLVGTPYGDICGFLEKYENDGFIWYFDIFALTSEDTYHSLLQMKRAGWFKNVKAVIVGRVCFEKTMVDMTYEEALMRLFGEDVPMLFGADVGHVSPSFTIINGAIADIEVKDLKINLKFIRE